MHRRSALWTGLYLLSAVCTGCRQAAEVAPGPSPEQQLCERWAELKNAGDGAADELLAALPEAPTRPVEPDEAERFQTDCFLRQKIQIVAVRPAAAEEFVLVTKGSVSAPMTEVRTPQGIDRVQRTMYSPDLTVRVRDGKIHGVRAAMHTER